MKSSFKGLLFHVYIFSQTDAIRSQVVGPINMVQLLVLYSNCLWICFSKRSLKSKANTIDKPPPKIPKIGLNSKLFL
jgi:hypothetical protein